MNNTMKKNLVMGLLCLLASCASGHIESVLRQDKDAYNVAAKSIKSGSDETESFRSMVDRMKSIDLSSCPGDFQAAYMVHVQAWESTVDEMEKQEGEFWKSILTGLIGIIADQPEITVGSLVSLLSQQGVDMSKVKASWRAVEASAIRHGASLPK